MIDHVCAHMQKMSNKKEIAYTIQVCDCTHYAVGRVLLCYQIFLGCDITLGSSSHILGSTVQTMLQELKYLHISL